MSLVYVRNEIFSFALVWNNYGPVIISLFIGGGGGGRICGGSHGFQVKWGGNQSSVNRGAIENLLPINCQKAGIIRLLQSLIGGSGKFYRYRAKIFGPSPPPPPHPTLSSRRYMMMYSFLLEGVKLPALHFQQAFVIFVGVLWFEMVWVIWIFSVSLDVRMYWIC